MSEYQFRVRSASEVDTNSMFDIWVFTTRSVTRDLFYCVVGRQTSPVQGLYLETRARRDDFELKIFYIIQQLAGQIIPP